MGGYDPPPCASELHPESASAQEGALGLRDVTLSLPAIVDRRRSAEVLRQARASINHQG